MRRKVVWGAIAVFRVIIGGAMAALVLIPSLNKTFDNVATQLEEAAPPKKAIFFLFFSNEIVSTLSMVVCLILYTFHKGFHD